jgi:hypothetical protein
MKESNFIFKNKLLAIEIFHHLILFTFQHRDFFIAAWKDKKLENGEMAQCFKRMKISS